MFKVMGLMCRYNDKLDNIVNKYYKFVNNSKRHPRILFNYEDRGGRSITLKLFEGVVLQIMRASFVITGFLSGWWCALALVQPLPPPTQYNDKTIDIIEISDKLINDKISTYNNNDLFKSNNINNKNLRIERSLRSKSESPREKRKNCRKNNGSNRKLKNWCPDMDISNRAYLSPTVFEGKARSMSSSRKPGSNYAVTFEVKQVYKSQSGFQPLRKNDSVRLHFRDKLNKIIDNKSSICHQDSNNGIIDDIIDINNKRVNYYTNRMINYYNQKIIRADIKRGKVYLVFVNRVGPRNFTILGEPVIRSKKNEQAVQAVVRPDYGMFFYFILY